MRDDGGGGRDVTLPSWWSTRRFGVFVHSNLATVPSFAPIGQYSDWYQSHLGEPVDDVLLHPTPLVEVLAHHRDRWAHVEHYDDFWPLLTYDRFDADEWVDLVRDAGMSYSVFVAKHHDGVCWWDAPGTDRTVLHRGPQRNVLAEFARACDRGDVLFGTYYSLLDWADARYPTADYVDQVLHPHVLDLVDRYGSRILWGDGHWGHGPELWRADELLGLARERSPDLIVNDRWWSREEAVATFEYQTPSDIIDQPWELCRGLGHSFCNNRAERVEHHMTAGEIIALLTEVVAKGGNLLLNIGPAADGTIPELQAAPLRRAGTWIREHADVINGSRPWSTWGDDTVRYLVPAAEPTADGRTHLDVVALGATPVLCLDALATGRGTVSAVTARDGSPVRWEQHESGLELRRVGHRSIGTGTGTGFATVYRVVVDARASAPIVLFDDEPAPPRSIGDRVADAKPGDVVQLGDGRHLGPIRVPAGVTVRGYGADRTILENDPDGGPTVVELAAGARLEHMSVHAPVERIAWFRVPVVRLTGADAAVIGCTVEGHVIAEADEPRLRASRLTGVFADGVDRVSVSRCTLTGNRWDVGVDLRGGTAHRIESCEMIDHLCAIRLDRTIGARVRANMMRARWWAVHLIDTQDSQVHANSVTATMRAVDVDGGVQATVSGNAVVDGDSGCVVERGASGTLVSGNRWERCRIGLLAWDTGPLVHHGNATIDLHDTEAALVIGP